MSKFYEWFTSDTHFFHKKIVEFCPTTRQGADADEMTEIMVQEWNKRVKPTDRVCHLGDFSFGSQRKTEQLCSRLNGIVDLYKGNHDGSWLSSLGFFNKVDKYGTIRIDGKLWSLFHFPIESWDEMKHDGVHLHGHLHGDDHHTCRLMRNRIDIGVDTRSDKLMAPFSYEEVLEKLATHNAAFDMLKQAGKLE